MKITIETEIQPFTIPSCVTVVSSPGRKQDGIKPAHTIDLNDLSMDVLIQLCDEFKATIISYKNNSTDVKGRDLARKMYDGDVPGY